ncbi:MAG: response regulator [Chloroflexota bacterium]
MAEKILIVDDDLDTLRLVGLMLDKQGYKIVAASSGKQALSLARNEKPDLILLDLMMPDMDGVEVARRLRADPETQNILIIMFTAKAQAEDRLEGYDAGADDYITKPAQPRELIAHVRAVLARAKRGQPQAAKPATPRGKVVGILAAKGGLGVSTVALNLGVVLHYQHKKAVIVADYRPGCGTIGLELGYSNAQSLNRMLMSPANQMDPALVESELITHLEGVRFMLSSPNPQDARKVFRPENYVAVTEILAHLAPFTILDLGPSITAVTDQVLEKCDLVVLVVEPVSQTILQTRAMIDYLYEKGIGEERVFPVLFNRLRAGVQLSLSQVQDQLRRPVSLVFTANPELAYQAAVETTPMVLKQTEGVTAQQFLKLADLVFQNLS